eukprot:1320898-Rhodomonas_salina.1
MLRETRKQVEEQGRLVKQKVDGAEAAKARAKLKLRKVKRKADTLLKVLSEHMGLIANESECAVCHRQYARSWLGK